MKKYDVIYIDPPWSYKSSGVPAAKRPCLERGEKPHSVNHYYETMGLKDIMELPINNLLKKNGVVFMWAVNPLLPESYEALKAWNVKYKTTLTWHKLRCKGMGYWFRGHTEFLLLGVKGKVKAFRSLEHNIKSHLVGKHSAKPIYYRDLIDSVTLDMPDKLEMFARGNFNLFEKEFQQGWDVYGNEVNGSISLENYYDI